MTLAPKTGLGRTGRTSGSAGLGVESLAAAADPISILGAKLAAWYTSYPSTLFTTSTGETPVTAASDPVGLRVNRVSGGPNASQATETARPLWQTEPNRIVYDPDDALNITLPAISGGQIVISSPVGIWIDSLDFAGGTFSLGPTTYTGGPAGLWSLLDNAELQVCVIDTAMTSEEQDKLVAYLVAQGSPGLITHPTEKLPGGDFEAGLIGVKSDGSGSVSTWSLNTTAPISGAQDGRLVITTQASLRPLIDFSSNVMSGFEAGKSYILELDYKINSGSFLFRYTIGGPVASVFGTVSAAGGKVRLIHKATATNTQLLFYFDSSTCDVQMDNISVREVILP